MTISKLVLFHLMLFIGISSYCQVPQAIKYQAVARSSNGNPVATKSVSIRISILQYSSLGQVVYQETQNVTTDNAGVFSIAIGMGTAITGVFSQINWASGNFFIKSEFDFGDGSGFQLSGTSEILSIPYAFYAGNGTQWKTNSDSSVYYNTTSTKVGIGTKTPAQALSVNGVIESITGGIKFPDGTIQTTAPNSNKNYQWKINLDSSIYYKATTGRVGIGTATPRSFLDVVSNQGGSQYTLNLSSTNSQGQAGAAIWNDNGGWLKVNLLGSQVSNGAAFGQSGQGTVQFLSNMSGAKDMLIGTLNNQSLILGTNNLARVNILSSGNVGVGTTTPAQALSVNGIIESTSGGIKYPDGTIQSSATSGLASSSDGNNVSINKSLSIFSAPSVMYSRAVWVRINNNTTDSLIYDFVPSQWYYFALTKKSTGEASIYINGTKMFKGSFANEAFNHYQLNIGAGFYTGWGSYLKGSFDGIRVSNISKDSVTIKNYWSSNIELGSEANTVALWNFNEGSGATFNSSVGTFTGNLVGSPQWVTGKFGKAISLNGTTDYGVVNITLPTTDVSYEAWVRFDAPITQYATIIEPYGLYNTEFIVRPSTVKNNEGVILKSPNGQCWKITVDNTGNLIRTAITCP